MLKQLNWRTILINEVNAIDYINNEIVNNKNIIRGHKTINNPDSICNNGLFMGVN